jgi:hypothetical protein
LRGDSLVGGVESLPGAQNAPASILFDAGYRERGQDDSAPQGFQQLGRKRIVWARLLVAFTHCPKCPQYFSDFASLHLDQIK